MSVSFSRLSSAVILSAILCNTLLLVQGANASHTVSASTPGGAYNSTQSVTLISTEPAALIYYTIDGTDPTTDSTQFEGTAIDINSNVTLKFIGIDPADNHTSAIFSEVYIITLPPPTVISVEPENGAKRVNPFSVINATFDRPMDPDTINSGTFQLVDQFGTPSTGAVTYDLLSNTASLAPDFRLEPGVDYIATLTDDVQDIGGTSLETTSWNFTTGGQIRITLSDVETFTRIPGSTFTITPHPFTLTGSLDVEDNGPFDSDIAYSGSHTDGFIILDNVDNSFKTYVISETVVPDGYSPIHTDVIVTVAEIDLCDDVPCPIISPVGIENIQSGSSIADIGRPVPVPPPYLNEAQFALYKDDVIIGKFSGIAGSTALPTLGPITSFASTALPASAAVTLETFDEINPDSFIFPFTAPAGSSANELFEDFEIPTYPGLTEDVIADEVIYLLPPVVIPYEDSSDNFILTPVIDKIFPGLTVSMEQLSFVESQVAKFQKVNMTFSTEGNNVGFSFGITDRPPPDTPEPPLDAPALFLDVGFIGDVDFSDPGAFQSSPLIDVVVNKTLPGFPGLPNGCPDFRLLFFNGTGWEEVQKLNPTGNFTDFCPFVLEPEHFSKFAVGGVKGQTISTENPPSDDDLPEETRDEERRSGGGGGGSRSTGVTTAPSGTDVETTATTQSGTVTLEFDIVEGGSGQLVVDTHRLSAFEEIFDDMAMMAQDNDEHGIVRLDGATYSTAGNIFDIDASEVNYQGSVEVTIPYDERTVTLITGSESDVRFLHYNDETGLWEDATSSVDVLANTVTGEVDSLSPVVAAVIISGAMTFDEEYFVENPLDRMEVASPSFSISEQTGEVTVTATVNNMQRFNQGYSLVAQIVDENNVAQYIVWDAGSAASGQDSAASIHWKPTQKGLYSATIFVLTEFDNPLLLSKAVVAEVNIE